MAMTTITVEFDDQGNAVIRKGDGSQYKVTDPAKLAEIMAKLADKLGPVIEKHKAHSHIRLDAGKMVQDEHIHE